jgi:type IV pilus assembly protein PilV
MRQAAPSNQSGVMLIEALVGILIFSIGIIALIGLQSAAIANSTESKYRSDAAFLSQKMIALIWVNRGEANKYDTSGPGGPQLTAWKAEVTEALPAATGSNAPTVSVTQVNATDPLQGFDVVVTIRWQKPGGDPRRYVATTRVVSNS